MRCIFPSKRCLQFRGINGWYCMTIDDIHYIKGWIINSSLKFTWEDREAVRMMYKLKASLSDDGLEIRFYRYDQTIDFKNDREREKILDSMEIKI